MTAVNRVTRQLAMDDVPELTELIIASRAHLEPWEPVRPERHFTVEGQTEMVRSALAEQHGGRMGAYAIVDDTGALAGRINLNTIVRGAGQFASVGYWLGADCTGQGLATRAVGEVVERAWHEWGLHRLEAGTLPHNIRSQKVLERNGFQRYGVARKYVQIAGRYQDHVLFELLAPELR